MLSADQEKIHIYNEGHKPEKSSGSSHPEDMIYDGWTWTFCFLDIFLSVFLSLALRRFIISTKETTFNHPHSSERENKAKCSCMFSEAFMLFCCCNGEKTSDFLLKTGRTRWFILLFVFVSRPERGKQSRTLLAVAAAAVGPPCSVTGSDVLFDIVGLQQRFTCEPHVLRPAWTRYATSCRHGSQGSARFLHLRRLFSFLFFSSLFFSVLHNKTQSSDSSVL